MRHVTNFVRIAKARSLAAEWLRQGKKPQDELTYPFHENLKIRSIAREFAAKRGYSLDEDEMDANIDALLSIVEHNSEYLLTLPREIIEETVGGLISVYVAYWRSPLSGKVTDMIGRMYTIKDNVGYGHQQSPRCLLTTWLLAEGSGVSMEDLTRYIMVGKIEALYEALKAMTKKLVKEHGDKARLHLWNPKLRSRGYTEWEQPEVY